MPHKRLPCEQMNARAESGGKKSSSFLSKFQTRPKGCLRDPADRGHANPSGGGCLEEEPPVLVTLPPPHLPSPPAPPPRTEPRVGEPRGWWRPVSGGTVRALRLKEACSGPGVSTPHIRSLFTASRSPSARPPASPGSLRVLEWMSPTGSSALKISDSSEPLPSHLWGAGGWSG